MQKKERQIHVAKVLRELNISDQDQLQSWLAKAGVTATQASLSRDLKDLGAVKVDGYYRLPEIIQGESPVAGSLKIERAGDHLIVFKTAALRAPALAALMDRSKIPGLLGTIAGDNTVFAAVASHKDQNHVIKKVVALARGKKS